jgi:acyl-CoA synthetase (NDP forming)
MTTAAMLSFFNRGEGGLGVFTTSGAGASLIADLADKHKVPVPELRSETLIALKPYLQFSTIGNPVDLGVFERGHSAQVPSLVAADPGLGACLTLINGLDPNSGVPTLTQDLAQARALSNKPFVVVVPGGLSDAQTDRYEADGIRAFPDTNSTIEAIGALLAPPPAALDPWTCASVTAGAPSAMLSLLSAGRPLTEPESLSILGEFGVSVVPTSVCSSIDEMIAAAERIGWPVVAKAVVEGVSHKTEAGLVRLDLRNADDLRKAYTDFGCPARTAIQPLIKGRAEAIVGLTWSADVGPIMLAGLGGIYAEALREVMMWSLPVSDDDIGRKLSDSALGRLLSSARWPNPAAGRALIETLQQLQAFARIAGSHLKAADVNPLVLTDEGAIAVDALIIPRTVGQDSQHGPTA